MAVIRTRRLFIARVATSDGGNPSFLYTVPAGRRAILRQATCWMESPMQPGTFPTWYVIVRVSGVSHWVYAHEFGTTLGLNEPSMTQWDQWNAMCVLHAGDQLGVECMVTTGFCEVQASGHELPES